MSRTIEQKHEGGMIVKPAELIEFRGTGNLTLHDRRVLNLLYENAGQRVCEDIYHVMALADLRGTHKGGERVKDSVIRLMQTIVEISTTGSDGKPATRRVTLLSETTMSDDEDNPTGEVVYALSKGLRDIIKDSTVWGRIQSQVMYAFTSKYALSLYEILQKRVNMSHIFSEEFEISDFRKLLGVPDGKLKEFFTLNSKCLKPALIEVNGLADHGVRLEPLRRGKVVYAIKMSWWKKTRSERELAYIELQRSKIGRLPRLKGTAETLTTERRQLNTN